MAHRRGWLSVQIYLLGQKCVQNHRAVSKCTRAALLVSVLLSDVFVTLLMGSGKAFEDMHGFWVEYFGALSVCSLCV